MILGILLQIFVQFKQKNNMTFDVYKSNINVV